MSRLGPLTSRVDPLIDEGSGWMRAEHVTLVLLAAALVLAHASDVAWDRFAAAFVLIDLVGYAPGAIAFRRAGRGRIDPVYHHLYSLAHSYLVTGAAVGFWALATGGLEWAMLAVPIHLSGDRGFLGNFPGRGQGRIWR